MTKEECEIETSKAIMEMRNHIAELEAQIENLEGVKLAQSSALETEYVINESLKEENATLKEKLNFSTQYYQGEKAKKQLTKAKEIISKLIALSRKEWVYADVREEAEAFLEED